MRRPIDTIINIIIIIIIIIIIFIDRLEVQM